MEPPAYTPRQPCPTKIAPFEAYLRERVAAYPELTGTRLHREIGELGYSAGQVVLHMLANVQQRTIKPIIKVAVTEGTLIHTDEYSIYAPLSA